jgi:outer membrane protein OmpA-like peptidoglycan-associated protein
MSRRALALALALLLVGCAAPPQGNVVLLPSPQPAAVAVTQGGQTLVLDQPYAGAELTRDGPRAITSSATQVQAQFGAALAAQPLPPARFTLYFVEGGNEFSAESKASVDRVFTEIAARPVPDVLVIGHTDAVGSDAFNDTLSRQRAEVVRAALIARGIDAGNIVAVGRGKRELLVATAAGVAEARNRRVEILVR